MTDTQNIVVDELLPHAPDIIWKALTSDDMIQRWLMPTKGFQAVEGNRFTFTTKPAGAWDGVIQCQVLEVVPRTRLVYSWKGGDAGNVGYGAPLDTVVTWTLEAAGSGTRVRLVHAGFVLPRNEGALKNMGEGWRKIVPQLGNAVVGEAK
ncbi:MAG TPA: SRPBCC domain-containing protein [Asticcacaulis sp.]|nr:SRPBCC domain-containing protein [Asticcacaulis sp.]